MKKIKPVKGWAIVHLNKGKIRVVSFTRDQAWQEWRFALNGGTPHSEWKKRAYRAGYRCIRVLITPLP